MGSPSPASTTRYVYLGSKLIAEDDSVSGREYTHTDGIGSPVARTGPTGALINRTRFEPYGAPWGGSGTPLRPYAGGFTGHVYDNSTGLSYMQQRYQDPMAGRFITYDQMRPATDSGARFTLYEYANSMPYRNVDPDGRDFADDLKGCQQATGTDCGYGSGASIKRVVSYGHQSTASIESWPQYDLTMVDVTKSTIFIASFWIPVAGELVAESMFARTAATAVSEGTGASTSFFEGAQYSSKVLEQMKGGVGEFHSFPESVTAFESSGTAAALQGGDGAMYQMLRIPGSYKSVGAWSEGEFQYIKDVENVINHRLFVPTLPAP